MKETDMTTCPHCEKKTPTGDVCRSCGKEIESAQGVEVHYKDFKGSEMLDIKMSSPARQEGDKLFKPPGNMDQPTDKSIPWWRRQGKNAVCFFWAAVVIILSALAWYALLNFLMKF